MYRYTNKGQNPEVFDEINSLYSEKTEAGLKMSRNNSVSVSEILLAIQFRNFIKELSPPL